MALTAGELVPTITPYIATVLDIVWMVLQLIIILGLIGYAVIVYMYDTKCNIREYSKGGRTINYLTRARRFKDRKTGTPKLQFFGYMGFMGEKINEPPAECMVPFKSRITNKMFDFVKKDGLYHPIQNYILGKKYEVKDEKNPEKVRIVYSIKGSGLEINRDYDSEQAIQNELIEKATQYRNRKPTEIIASFAMMIITIIVCGIVMWFALKQFGNMSGAIASLGEPLREGIAGAAQNILGPG